MNSIPRQFRPYMAAVFATTVLAAILLTVMKMPAPWWIPLAIVPLYLTFSTYKVYVKALTEERGQVRELADLHLATIEALAVAIDAKDQTCQSHIRRVQHYACALARSFGMSANEVEGVRTAALLHDIGKLAVPEHILSKPGPLTAEEFEKIRAHPKIGADIIASVPFPYPVAPLILNHHERWDGRGYPSGLRGEDIPLGARIISVVDYFDALMTERPYHTAMPFDAALALVQQESGNALDPAVVDRFLELLPRLRSELARFDTTVRKPSADDVSSTTPGGKKVFEDIALAHREIYALYEIAQAMGTSLSVSDTMALITTKLSSLVPFSCAALYLYEEESDSLHCRFAKGVDAELIQQVVVRSGEGLAGWVTRNRRTLVNARPRADLDAAGLDVPTQLQSALLCPLTFGDRFIGVLSVYHVNPGFYGDDHRRLLERVSQQAGAVVNNSILFEQTHEDSLTDPLTSLPNTRYLYMHLTRELARADRLKTEVALLVMDVDNFKTINDTHGHHVGDQALVEVSRHLRTAIRPYDVCVRYAGDEFIIVLAGCGVDEVENKRQELQRGIAEIYFEPRFNQRVNLGMSIGAAVFPYDGDNYESLLAAADARMYQDKGGRKRRDREPELNAEAAAAGIL